jgi:hypothetical protein
MKNTQRGSIKLFILIILTLVLIGCNANQPTQILPTQKTQVVTPSPEPSATPSPTPVPPTTTNMPPPPTNTPTPTETSTSTPTPTSEPPTLVVNEDAACRVGPGLIYDINAYLSAGAVPILLGQDRESTWWSVEEPTFNNECWVSSDVVSVQGDTDKLPIFTPLPTSTIEPSPTQKQKGVIYYLVALNTGGPVGCGDTLIPVYTGIPTSGDIEKDIHNALHALLKLKVKDFGGYYNPLYNAHLNTGGVKYNPDSGNVTVNLSGSIPKPEDECEYHRVRGVLWETVRHYKKVNGVTYWIGDKLIGDLIAIIDR